jgi:hypothetical protein
MNLCGVQGSILDSHVEVLNHRLRGLCDNVDCGQERFHEKELVGCSQCFGSALVSVRIRIQHFRSLRIRFQIQGLMTKNWKKFPDYIFLIEIAILLF